MRQKWGPALSRKLKQRLAELQAAETLDDISHLPPARCHELKGDRAGQLSIDLGHPFRLILEPDEDPIPRKPDGGLDRTAITMILVVEVCATHT